MPSIQFLLRSAVKKNIPFVLRLQFYNPDKVSDSNVYGSTFIEAKTQIYVFTPEEVKKMPLADGVRYWKDYSKKTNSDPNVKGRIDRIKQDQTNLKNYILDLITDNTIPTKEWLQSIIIKYYEDLRRNDDRKEKKSSIDLTWHFDNYIKIKSIDVAARTLLKIEDIKNIILRFEQYQSDKKNYTYKIQIPDVNDVLRYELIVYLKNIESYSHNTIAKIIKVIRTVCNYSQKYGIELNLLYDDFRMAYEDKDVVFLSFEELKAIKNTSVPVELQNAKDWLYLSCFLGQRISDFMRFEKSMIVKKGDTYTVDFTQEKTGKKMQLLIHPEVLSYLESNNFNFPKPIEEQKYNSQIKIVCKLAGIIEKIKGSAMTEIKKGVWRNKAGVYPKYELIGSHIGRKSFASNFYGLIPTTLIMQVTGHSEERTLLEYIGKKDATNNALIYDYYKNIKL